jgi:hypothetical protein
VRPEAFFEFDVLAGYLSKSDAHPVSSLYLTFSGFGSTSVNALKKSYSDAYLNTKFIRALENRMWGVNRVGSENSDFSSKGPLRALHGGCGPRCFSFSTDYGSTIAPNWRILARISRFHHKLGFSFSANAGHHLSVVLGRPHIAP